MNHQEGLGGGSQVLQEVGGAERLRVKVQTGVIC